MSHHSNDGFDEEQRKAMHAAMQKVFGEYPEGKLNKNDKGGLAFIVEHENGKVVLKFPKPVAWIGFTPEQAVEIAQHFIRHARECGFKSEFTIRI
jgi:hypothetical protein